MIKKLLPLLLCLMMIMSAVAVTASAVRTEPNITVNSDKTEVIEGDEIVVNIGIKNMKATSIMFELNFDPELLTLNSITAKRNTKVPYKAYDPDEGEWYEDELTVNTMSNKSEASSGHVGVAFVNTDEVLYIAKENVVTLKFTANKSGTVSFEMEEDSDGTDGYFGTWTYPEISTPTCDHVDTEKTYVSNGDNTTHTVTCACGEVVNASEACSGGTATCTAKAVCSACEAEYGELAGHDYGELVAAQEEVHTKDELKAAVAAHYQCSACNAYFDEDKNETTLYALTGETPVHVHARYGDITDTTHQSYCSCGAKINNPELHDYNGTVEHTCVCDKVEEFTLSVYIEATGNTVQLSVPYGANILDVLNQAVAEGLIPVVGEERIVKNNEFNGKVTIGGFIYGDNVPVDDQMTMPGNDFDISQDYTWITGWCYTIDADGDGVGDSYEFLKPDGKYMTGWNYIEEDYDGVDGGAWYYFYDATDMGFEKTFFRAEGLTRVVYPEEEINGKTYVPNPEDLEFAANNAGSLYTDAETAVFVFGEDGKFDQSSVIIVDTTTVPGKTIRRYAKDGCVAWHVGMVEFEGDYYYFGGDTVNGGNVMMTGYIYATRDCKTGKAVGGNILYFFNPADGKMVMRNGIIHRSDVDHRDVGEGYFYYESGAWELGKGVVELKDDESETFYIYVRSNGLLATGYYWPDPAKTNGYLEPGKYNFGTEGKYYPDAVVAE